MMVPGVIAYHLYGSGLDSIDLAYPQLVKDTLPTWALGFFLAVLLGAVFSSFNSLINSSATMLTLDVIQPLARQPIEDARLVSIAKISSIGIAAVSLGIAPLLQFAPEGLWQIIRIFSGFYNIPIIAVVLVGMLTTRVPALAVKVAIGFHLIAYALLQFVFKDVVNIHFLHLYAILFVSEVAILLLIGHLRPAQVRSTTRSAPVDMTPWVFAKACSFSLFSCVVLLYMIFSPLGLAGGSGGLFTTLTALLVVINILVWVRTLVADRLHLQRQGVQ